MKNILILLIISVFMISCSNGKHADFEKNTEIAKKYLKLHEVEDAESMFAYLHEDIQWHMPVYGMEMGGIDEVKAAILGYQSEFDNMKFTANYWLPGVDTDTGKLDGSTRVYGTWVSTHVKTGKEAKLTTYHSFEFKDGKIISGGDWFDLGGMMNALLPQSLEKGSLVGLHALNVKLKNGATSEEFKDYFINEFIPKYESAYKGATLHLVDGIRGKNEGSLGMMWIFDSNEARNLYFEENGQPTKLNQEIGESLNGVNEGLSKLGNWTSQYTDWEIN